MSILDIQKKVDQAIADAKGSNRNVESALQMMRSKYEPTPEERDMIRMVTKDFSKGYDNLWKPRREFNDLSCIDRMSVDQMMWNTYQPNDGDAPAEDWQNGWRSRAIRPVARNKVISMAAHMTAQTIFPKIFARNEQDEEQNEAAMVMSDLMEYAGDDMDYQRLSLYAILGALINPVSVVHLEYTENYREVKRPDADDPTDTSKYKKEAMLDEDLSGFQATVLPPDEFFYEDFYQNDIQKQGFVIWRRVMPYSLAYAKYANKYENFQYVKPGVQTIYVDANTAFYELYDSNMTQNDVEEVLYWNKQKDLFQVVVNGVLLTDVENCNPRQDKKYPFVSFYFEPFDEGRAICGKSLVFKVSRDDRIINELYPMVIDGTYLNIFKPMTVTGGESIGSDVIIPGAVTTLQDPNSELKPIMAATDIGSGLNALNIVQESVNESSQEPISTPQGHFGNMTATQSAILEKNNQVLVGFSMTLYGHFVKKFGELLIGDILQHLTVAQANAIEGKSGLLYKSFLLPDKMSGDKMKTHKISFDMSLPDGPMTPDDIEDKSFDILEEEGGEDSTLQIYKVNPERFRMLKYSTKISPDILNPVSEETDRLLSLEEYDRAIKNPLVDQEAVTRDFLLGAYPKSKRDPSKYMKSQQEMDQQMNPQDQFQQLLKQQGSPLKAIMGSSQPVSIE